MADNIQFLLKRIAYLRDEQAYKTVFIHFHPGLFRFCMGIVKHAEVAEEILSDTLLKIWTMESRLNYVENIELYLFKTVKNASLTWLSRQKNEYLSLGEEHNYINEPVHNSVEYLYINTETGREIEKAISILPQQCQLVFRLAKQEGFSYKQISAILEISQNTIESHMRTALKRIKTQLEAYLEEKK